jgi:hypothetical protein
MDELVERLSKGEHPVEVSIRPERTPQGLKDQIERGYVHIKFTGTSGGTELGVRLDREASDFSNADFESPAGTAKFVGDLTLNYVKVQCIADIDLASYSGTGHLAPVAEVAMVEAQA